MNDDDTVRRAVGAGDAAADGGTGDDGGLDLSTVGREFVFRANGSAVRAVLDPDGPDPADALDGAHEPEHDDIAARCPAFWPGHQVHWIQASRGLGNPGQRVEILAVEGLDVRVRLGSADPVTWRLHDPSLLLLELLVEPVLVGWLHEPSLLRLRGRLFYPCADLSLWRPCPAPSGRPRR